MNFKKSKEKDRPAEAVQLRLPVIKKQGIFRFVLTEDTVSVEKQVTDSEGQFYYTPFKTYYKNTPPYAPYGPDYGREAFEIITALLSLVIS